MFGDGVPLAANALPWITIGIIAHREPRKGKSSPTINPCLVSGLARHFSSLALRHFCSDYPNFTFDVVRTIANINSNFSVARRLNLMESERLKREKMNHNIVAKQNKPRREKSNLNRSPLFGLAGVPRAKSRAEENGFACAFHQRVWGCDKTNTEVDFPL